MRLVATVVTALSLAAPAAAANAPPIRVRPSLSPGTALFAAPVTAQVDVLADAEAVDPATIRVAADVTPFRRLGPAVTERIDADGTVVVRQRVRIACAAPGCVPREALRAVALPRVRVTARTRAGRSVSVAAAWPPAQVARRVPSEAVSGEPGWRFDERPREPSYRLSPGVLVLMLWTLAAVLALAGLGLAGLEAARWGRRRRVRELSPMQAALAAVRAAAHGDEVARRRAVGELARVLEEHDGRFVDVAAELAWSEGRPDPRRLSALADDVERTVRV